MDCQDVRPRLIEYRRNRLAPEVHEGVQIHLAACVACARAEASEHALTEILERRTPQYPAPFGLKRRLEAEWPAALATAPARPAGSVPLWRRWGRPLLPALAVAAVLLVALPFYRSLGPSDGGLASLTTEAVNDHLRVLTSQHPLDVQSGGIHQVKPWFEGRLDFAPVVTFEGDEEFALEGGGVGYFLDRKAAIFVFRRKLHGVSLFVFRSEGLPWPDRGLAALDGLRAHTVTTRGFNVVLWRVGELGYALVSDIDATELARLAPRIAG